MLTRISRNSVLYRGLKMVSLISWKTGIKHDIQDRQISINPKKWIVKFKKENHLSKHYTIVADMF